MKAYKLTVFEILRDFYYYILCVCVIPTHRVYQLYGTPPSLLCWTVQVSGCQWLLCSKGLIYAEDGKYYPCMILMRDLHVAHMATCRECPQHIIPWIRT